MEKKVKVILILSDNCKTNWQDFLLAVLFCLVFQKILCLSEKERVYEVTSTMNEAF